MIKNRNLKNNKRLGGGEEHKSSLFKPIVATSLALALGVSVAVATDTKVATDANLSYGQNGSTNSPQTSTITQQITWDNGGASVGGEKIDYVVMQFSDALGTKVPTTSFTLNKNTDITFGNYNPNYGNGTYQDKNVFDITYGTSKSTKPYLSFNAGGNAIVLQNGENRGAFVADLGISSQAREMGVVLNGSMAEGSKTYSLQGDFIARSGANATLNVEFSNSVKGNIKTINVIGNDYYQINENGDPLAFSQNTTTRTFTFRSGATLEGDIIGGNLDSSGVTQHQNKIWFNNFIDQFVFEDSNLALQNISYYSGSTNISIKGNGTIQDVQTGWGGYDMAPNAKNLSGLTGSIHIAFEKADTGTNSINKIVSGGGLVDVIFGASRGDTEITTATGNATSTITKGISARDGSVNLVFATNGVSTINAIGDTNGVGRQPELYDDNDAFRFRGGGGTATANITFLGSGENKIDGNIMSYGDFGAGKKVLNLTFANGASSILGSVRAHGNVVNNIVFQENSTISNSIGDILASTTAAGGKGENLISFYGADKALSVGSMTVDLGRNTIGKDIEKNMAIDDFMNASHMADGTLSVTKDIVATNGENLINVKTLETKNITATAGTNVVYANTAGITGNVSITGNARTLITTEGALSVTGSIIATTGTTDSKNNIVLNVNGFNVTQDIKTQGGYGTGIKITSSGTDNTIGGKLLAGGGNSINSNEITLTASNANLTITGGMGFDGYGRNGTSGNQNTITFQNGGTLTVNGTGITASGDRVYNTITFQSDNNATIAGNISITNGITNITFDGNGTNTITGEIFNQGGAKTNITSASFLTISGSVTANTGTNDTKDNIIINTAGFSVGGDVKTESGYGTGIKITSSGRDNTITGKLLAGGGNSINSIEVILTAENANLTIGNGIGFNNYGRNAGNQNIITFQNGGTLNVTTGGIVANYSNVTNTITFQGENNGTINGAISTSAGTARTNISFSKMGTINNSLNLGNGTTNITAETLNLNGSGDVIKILGGRLDIVARDLIIKRANGGSAVWSSNGSQTNITIKDGGSLSAYHNNGTDISNITSIALDKKSQFQMTFEGDATIKANFTAANSSSTNQNTMNFGSENSSGAHTVTLNGALTNNSSVGIANLFNFNADDFTFTFKNSSNAYQDLAIENSRANAISFNANNGVFDLGTNILNITGTLGINLAQTDSVNTIKAGSITSGGNTTIGFNADNTTLGLVNNGSMGTLTTSGGTTAINIAEGMNGIFSGKIATSGGATNVVFQGAQSSSLTLQGTSSVISNITAIATPTEGRTAPVSTLILDGSNSANSTSTAGITNGQNLNIHFKGADNDKTFAITSGDNTLNSVFLDSGSTNNTLDISNSTKLQILSTLNIGADESSPDLTIKLADTELATAGVTTTSGTSTILVGQTSNGATISGSNINISTLKMEATTGASITFANAESVFGKLDSTIASGGSQNYNLTLAQGSSLVKFSDTQGTATLSSVTFNGTSGEQTLEFGGGNVSLNAISASNESKSILQLSSGSTFETANSTNVSASGITNGSGSGLHILFTGGTDDQIHLSTLTLTGSNNLASVESQAKNAVIKLDGSTGSTSATIGEKITIGNGNSLVFSLTSGTSSSAIATATGGIEVQSGGTFGISIGSGDGSKSVSVGNNGANNTITFADNSTLLIDFQNGATGNVTLGTSLNDNSNGNKVVIGTNRNSIINFHGNNNGASVNGGIKIAGGNNTVNFLGDASLSNIEFSSGNNTINVRDNGKSTGVTATINLADSNGSGSQLGNMTNTINLENNATLDLQQTSGVSGGGTLMASDTNKPSTLNFIGDNATFKGGLNATSGKATINVGYVNTQDNSLQGVQISDTIKGTITGEVTNADVIFNANKSQLVLKGDTNTFKSLQTKATDGILTLDASANNVSVSVGSGGNGNIVIDSNTSLTFDLTSNSSYSATANIGGNITVKNGGTLGIAIGGTGGTRSVTMGGGTPTLEAGSTLRVDFLAGSQGSATLGSGSSKFEIGIDKNTGIKSKSIINFYAGSNATLNGGGLKLTGGDNTANFYGSATLGGIELDNGTNTINVKSGTNNASITATLLTDSLGGSKVATTLNLEDYAIVDLKNAEGANSGSGSITASVNVNGVNTKILGNLTSSSVTFTTSNADLTLQGANTLTSLTGYTPVIASYVRNGRVINTSSQNILTLDATTNGASVTVAQTITGNSVALKFGNGSNSKTFTLSEGGNTLSGVLFGSNSTNNTLAFTKGVNAITEAMSIVSGNGLTLALGNETTNSSNSSPVSLNLAGGLIGNGESGNGSASISIKGQNSAYGILSGGAIDAKSLEFGATTSATLVVKNSSATFGTLTANNTSILTLDGSDNGVAMTINKLASSGSLTTDFNGNDANSTMLKIVDSDSSNKTITLSGITVASGSANNTLDLSSLTKATISNGVEIIGSEDARKELTINLKDTELNLAEGLSTENATTTINVIGDSSASATLSGGDVVVTNLNMSGTGALQTTFKNSSTTIDNLSASGNTSNAIILNATNSDVSTTINNAIAGISGKELQVTLGGNDTYTAELVLNNADNQESTLKSITLSESSSDTTHNILSLTNGKTTITESYSIESGKGLGINLSGTTELVNGTISNNGSLAINAKDSANATITGAIITTSNQTTEITLGNSANMTISGALNGEGSNNISFQASSSNEEGTITSNSLTLGGNSNKIATLKAEDSSNAYLKGSDATINTITLGNGKSANLTLMNTNSTITTLSGKGMLSIDATDNAVTASISQEVTNGSNLTLNFNGQGSSKQASLTLGAGGNFKTLTASSASTGNALSLGANTTSFSDKVELENGVDMTFNLSNGTTLALNGGLIGGTTTLAVSSNGSENSATLSGKATGNEIANIALSNVNLSGSNASTLTLKAQSITIDTLSATATTSNTLKLDDTENAVNAVIQQNLSGDALALSFKGVSNGVTLALNGSTNTIKSISVEGSSTLNTLSLTKGTTTINDATTISNGALNIDLGSGSKLVATNDFTTSGGVSTFNLNDATLQAKGTNGIQASGGTTNINFLQGASSIIGSGLKVENGGTLNLNVSSNAIANFNTLSNAGTANLSFKGSDGVLYFTPTSSSNATLTLSSISSEGGNNIVDIASNKINGEFTIISDRKDFRVLKIGSANSNEATIKGQNIGFKLFVDKNQEGTSSIGGDAIGNNGQSTSYGYAYSDRIIVNSKSDASSTHTLYIVPKIDELSKIAYNGGGTEVANNVAVATIKKDSGITLGTEKVLNGFEVIQAELIAVDTDENGKAVVSSDPSGKAVGDYTTYFLGKVTSVGTSIETQEVASTALSINYDLYIANLNSLNKRMGELRDNSHNQGVWARVFGGAQSSSFGIGSDTEYVTVQAGYDYDFDFSNAKNYLGVALSYATSTSKSLSATQNIVNANASSNNMVGIDNINSNAYEVAVYNAYVSDSGWYNDTIAKFSYINSTFSLTNSANESSTTNMAFTLSDEVGYRYKFAENEKGNWYIDPQLELAFGYLNQSDFNSVIASTSTSGFSNLNAFQDAVMTLRTRIGATLGKKFNTDKGFASLYVGAFYEYDYVAGGDSDVGVESGAKNTLSPLSSSGRAVLNVGSNIELTKGARLYIDVEKSFGDKFRTHMQFNVGTRYSF